MSAERLLSIGKKIRLGKKTYVAEGKNPEEMIRTAAYFLGEKQIQAGRSSDSIANCCIAEGEICLSKATEILKGK